MAGITESRVLFFVFIAAAACGPRAGHDSGASDGFDDTAGTGYTSSTSLPSGEDGTLEGVGSDSTGEPSFPECPGSTNPPVRFFRYVNGMPGEPWASEGYTDPCEVREVEHGDDAVIVRFDCYEWDMLFTPEYVIYDTAFDVRIPEVGEMMMVSSSRLMDANGEIILEYGAQWPTLEGLPYEWVHGFCPYEEIMVRETNGWVQVNAEKAALEITHEGGVARLFEGDTVVLPLPDSDDSVVVSVLVAYCREPPDDDWGIDECYRPGRFYQLARLR